MDALVEAMRRLDFQALAGWLHPEVRMRALLPGGPVEVLGRAGVVARMRAWFAGCDAHEALESGTGRVGPRAYGFWRLRVRENGRWYAVGQHAYAVLDDEGLVTGLDLLCSGFHPDNVEYDAGGLGCADGLAREFRERIARVPVGATLAVTVADPGAKHDLPAFARLLGHAVTASEPNNDGTVTITVERRA